MKKNEALLSVFAVLVDNTDPEKSGGKDSLEYVKTANGCTKAVMVLLKTLKPDKSVVDFVALRYLDIFKKSRRVMAHFNSLAGAVSVVEFGGTPSVIEKVVEAAAKNGWLRVEDMARRLLHRDLRTDEVYWLVRSYVYNSGTQSNDQEAELSRLAHRYMGAEDALKVDAMLEKFARDFNRL